MWRMRLSWRDSFTPHTGQASPCDVPSWIVRCLRMLPLWVNPAPQTSQWNKWFSLAFEPAARSTSSEEPPVKDDSFTDVSNDAEVEEYCSFLFRTTAKMSFVSAMSGSLLQFSLESPSRFIPHIASAQKYTRPSSNARLHTQTQKESSCSGERGWV